jgi:hypothetical protein
MGRWSTAGNSSNDLGASKRLNGTSHNGKRNDELGDLHLEKIE